MPEPTAPKTSDKPDTTVKPASVGKLSNLAAISLEQALIDVEIANARVIELTRRLTSAAKEIAALRGQLAGSRIPALEAEVQSTKAELASLRLQHAKDLALVHLPS